MLHAMLQNLLYAPAGQWSFSFPLGNCTISAAPAVVVTKGEVSWSKLFLFEGVERMWQIGNYPYYFCANYQSIEQRLADNKVAQEV